MRKTIIAYTDGSAVVSGPNKGKAGFACYFPDYFGTGHKAWSLGFKQGKTGGMEVTALLYAIKAMPLKSDEKITLVVYSDSQYVVKSFIEGWLNKWSTTGWKNNTVANRKLWENILGHLMIRDYITLEMHHIKSHQVEKAKKAKNQMLVNTLMKNPHIIGNMMADKLADYKRHKTLL